MPSVYNLDFKKKNWRKIFPKDDHTILKSNGANPLTNYNQPDIKQIILIKKLF